MDISTVCQKLETGNYWLTTSGTVVKKDCWLIRFFKNLFCQYEHIKAERVIQSLKKKEFVWLQLGSDFFKVFDRATGRRHTESIVDLALTIIPYGTLMAAVEDGDVRLVRRLLHDERVDRVCRHIAMREAVSR